MAARASIPKLSSSAPLHHAGTYFCVFESCFDNGLLVFVDSSNKENAIPAVKPASGGAKPEGKEQHRYRHCSLIAWLNFHPCSLIDAPKPKPVDKSVPARRSRSRSRSRGGPRDRERRSRSRSPRRDRRRSSDRQRSPRSDRSDRAREYQNDRSHGNYPTRDVRSFGLNRGNSPPASSRPVARDPRPLNNGFGGYGGFGSY